MLSLFSEYHGEGPSPPPPLRRSLSLVRLGTLTNPTDFCLLSGNSSQKLCKNQNKQNKAMDVDSSTLDAAWQDLRRVFGLKDFRRGRFVKGGHEEKAELSDESVSILRARGLVFAACRLAQAELNDRHEHAHRGGMVGDDSG